MISLYSMPEERLKEHCTCTGWVKKTPRKWWLSARFSTCFRFGGLKSLSPSVNNLFRGIPFSHENKIHEHIQESLLLGRRKKGNFACFFARFCRFSKGPFCRKSPISAGRNDRLKPFVFIDSPRAYLLTHPVVPLWVVLYSSQECTVYQLRRFFLTLNKKAI